LCRCGEIFQAGTAMAAKLQEFSQNIFIKAKVA